VLEQAHQQLLRALLQQTWQQPPQPQLLAHQLLLHVPLLRCHHRCLQV
jgi:hypothetical protein